MEVEGYSNIVNPIRRTYFVSGDGRRGIVYDNYSDNNGGRQKDRRHFETGLILDVVA